MECSNCERRVLSRKGGSMRTLYYVNAGASWFGFYLDEGALALANDGARFNSFGAVLAWAGEHDFDFVAKCEPEGSARVATEMRRKEGKDAPSCNHNSRFVPREPRSRRLGVHPSVRSA